MSKEKRKPSAPPEGPAKPRKTKKPPADTSRGNAAAPDEHLPRPEHTATERAYLDWMRRRGVELHGVTIGKIPPHRARMRRDARHLPRRRSRRCPTTASSSQTCVAADDFRELDDAVADGLSPRLEREALVLAVMAEMSLGADSAFAPYLAALPITFAPRTPRWRGAAPSSPNSRVAPASRECPSKTKPPNSRR